MTDFPDFDRKERKVNKAVDAATFQKGRAQRALLTQGMKLSSEQILEALEASGKDATWYSETLGALIQEGTPRAKLRALELIAKIVSQKEGKKVLTGELADWTQEQLEEAFEEVKAEMAETQGKRESPKSN